MRVTKTIREYIEKEVKARVEPKYALEATEAKRQSDTLAKFHEGAAAAAKAAWTAYFEEHFSEIADFAEDTRTTKYGSNLPGFYNSGSAKIADYHETNSVHRWQERCRTESKRIVDEIVVELELGGTKAELMEMLEKI